MTEAELNAVLEDALSRHVFGTAIDDEDIKRLAQHVEDIRSGKVDRPFKNWTNSASETWPRPIPVSERLPEGNQEILAYSIDEGWLDCRYNGRFIRSDFTAGSDPEGYELENVTHWLPLPPAPE